MTREEAIERLKQNKAAAKFYAGMSQNTNAIENELKDIEAMDMAIEALSNADQRTQYVESIDLISRQDAIDALECINGIKEVIEVLPSADRPIGWIPISDIQKLQDILYLHIDSLEGTKNIVEAGMLSAWKEVVEYLDGMLGEDGEA